MWAVRPTAGPRGGPDGPCRPVRAGPYVLFMKKIKFTKAPTFTKAIIASAIFAITYLASTSNLPSCSDTAALLNGNGECIERQSFLHTASGWLALICLIAAVLLLAVKHKDSILGRQSPAKQAYQGPSAPPQMPVPVPGRASGFCAKCGTRIIPGDRFCQGCGAPMEAH
jgi:zinc-ribbon domain